MKYIIVTLSLVFLTGISSLSVYSGTISVSGTLSKEITTTTYTAPIEIKNCDGVVLSTIPSESITTKKYEPYAKSGQTLRFTVTRLENPEVTIVTIDTNINNINYNASDGQFSVDLVRSLISESRYNYKVKIGISENSYATVLFEREYSIAPAGSGSAFPIGSVIAYLGNNGNIAGMEANGWFKCDGRSISGLSALSADEKTAFTNILGGSSNLPDLRGIFLRGLDDGVSGYRDEDRLTRTGGENTTGVRSTEDESMRKHTHLAAGSTSTDGSHGHSWRFNTERDDEGQGGSYNEYTQGGSGYAAGADNNPISSTGSEHSHAMSFLTRDPSNSEASVSSYAGNENRPDNTAVYYLIRGR
ncbi:MAG: phage tail protein [Bacteroidota bacterium]